jgi:hypothetical protein
MLFKRVPSSKSVASETATKCATLDRYPASCVDAGYREIVMTQAKQPSKYVVRKYLERRSQSTKPPPSLDEIRRQLGWQLLRIDRSG